MAGIFGILEFPATQWCQDVAPTEEFFFHRHIYSLCSWGPYKLNCLRLNCNWPEYYNRDRNTTRRKSRPWSSPSCTACPWCSVWASSCRRRSSWGSRGCRPACPWRSAVSWSAGTAPALRSSPCLRSPTSWIASLLVPASDVDGRERCCRRACSTRTFWRCGSKPGRRPGRRARLPASSRPRGGVCCGWTTVVPAVHDACASSSLFPCSWTATEGGKL